LVWASVSRAVRTPSRLDRELVALPILVPAPNFQSEIVTAYEAGYRGELFDRLTLSVSGFYNHYDDLRTTNLLFGGTGLVAQLRNGLKGDTYGIETWAQVGITDWWRLSGGVTALEKDLAFKPGVVDISNMQAAGNDPGYQFSIRSLMTPIPGVDIDIGLRSVDNLIAPAVRSYVELDVRLGWRIADNIEVSVAAFNLLHDQHPEGGPLTTRREIRRNVQGTLKWAF
jgi:iron complex outermembrane receptor protein